MTKYVKVMLVLGLLNVAAFTGGLVAGFSDLYFPLCGAFWSFSFAVLLWERNKSS